MSLCNKRTLLSVAIASALLAFGNAALASDSGSSMDPSVELSNVKVVTSTDSGYRLSSPNTWEAIFDDNNDPFAPEPPPGSDQSDNAFTLTVLNDSKGTITGPDAADYYCFISGQTTLEGLVVQNNSVTFTAENRDKNVVDGATYVSSFVKTVEIYGAYVAPTSFMASDEPLADDKLITLQNNALLVKDVTLDVANNGGNASKFIGAGAYWNSDDSAAYYRANAFNNSVTIENSTLSGNTILLGGVGRTSSGNTVELKNTIVNEFDQMLLGGRGLSAEGNTLKISGGSYTEGIDEDGTSLASPGMVGGGYGVQRATKNKVEINGGDKGGDINGTFKGGTSLVNASGNSIVAGGENLSLGGELMGGFVIHSTDATELSVNDNAVTVTQHINKTGDDLLDVIGAGALFTSGAKDANLSMTGNKISISGSAAEEKLEVGDVVANYVGVATTNAPKTITATGAEISLENVKAIDVHALRIEEGSPNTYVANANATIRLTNAEVTGEVGVVDRNGVEVQVTGAENSVLIASGVNKVGSFGDDIKNVKLFLGDINREKAVITFTSTEDKSYSGLSVEAHIGELSRARMARAATRGANDPKSYLLFGSASGAGTTTLSGTIEFTGTFTSAEQSFNGTVSNGSTMSVQDALESGSAVDPSDPSTPSTPSTPSEPTVTANNNAKTLSESLLGSVALISQGSEFIADEGLAAMNAAAKVGSVTAFGAMTGGHVRYETGSHVNVDSALMALGAATKFGNATVAGFIEFGKADSTAHVNNTKADGDHQSYGLGVAARYDFNAHLYADASLRAGRSETEFDGYYDSTGEKAHYDAKSTYASAHLGGGYVFNVTSSLMADVYARGIVSYLGSDTVSLGTTDNEKVHFDSTTAETLQLGARLKGDVSQNAFWRAGAGWIHVFGGDADASVFVDGLAPAKIESPSLSGNAFVFDAGFTMKPSEVSPWTFDFALKGYAGDRRGVTGTVQAGYRF